MLSLIGYTDRLSARAGETIEFKVSSTAGEPFQARLVRVISADPNPAGPGLIEHSVDASFEGSYPSRVQPFFPGSYGVVPTQGRMPALGRFTLTADIWPTSVGGREQAILALASSANPVITLLLDEAGAIAGRVADQQGKPTTVSTGKALTERRWYRVWLTFDGDTGELSATALGLAGAHSSTAKTLARHRLQTEEISQIFIAAEKDTRHFNGKVDSPAIFEGVVDISDAAGRKTSGLVARWDFSRGISSTRIEDVGLSSVHGELINMPARAMTGSSWDGSEMCWRHAPEHYGAIHFHDDDIYDFHWETDFRFTIPDDLPSGVYAARIDCGEHSDAMPFFVCPPKGQARASLCVLVSTFTYTVYGNHARPDFRPSWKQRTADWEAYPHNAAEYPEYGLSTYNFHRDGSGICHASYRRPLFFLILREMDLHCAYPTVYLDDSRLEGYPEDHIGTPSKSPWEVIGRRIIEVARGGRIGVEFGANVFSYQDYGWLTKVLEGQKVVDGTGIVQRAKIKKSPAEIAYMQKAAKVVDNALQTGIAKIAEGVRECDVAATITQHLISGTSEYGGGPTKSVSMGVGHRAAAPHLKWTDAPYQPNTQTDFEVGGYVHRYCCPLSRTVYLGDPPQRLLDLHEAVLAGFHGGIDAGRPGACCGDIYRGFAKAFFSKGFRKESRIGYSVGLDWSDLCFSLQADDDTVLEESYTFHFIIGIWEREDAYVFSEAFRVSADGLESFSATPRILFVR